LPGATSDKDGVLGYCWMHHFKCHSARACHTWAKGGPIDKDKESHNWQERAFGKKLEEMPYYRKIRDKIHQMIHPKGYERIMKMYIDKIKSGMKPMQAAGEIGKEVRGVEGRDVIYYVNNLVKKGKLPKELAASYTEGLWDNIRKKKARIKRGSGEKMRKKGEKGAPSSKEWQKAQEQKESFQLDEKIEGLVKKAEKSGMPYSILKKVYDRGMAAWRTGHRPGTTPQQWAFARVNSFVTKSSGTWGKADKDLAKQVRGETYEQGEDYARHTFAVTPGQNYEQSIKKKASKTNIKDWFERESVRKEYQKKYEDYWWTALTETYDRMLEKIGTQDDSIDKYLDEGSAEYQGRKVNLNNPTRSDSKKKKYMVYVKNDKGNVVKVHYGDPNMQIQRDNDAARKNFRARHQCDTNPGPKYKARYWSCKFWEKGKSVTDLMKG